MTETELHQRPYRPIKNNRKLNRSRIKTILDCKVQSIPIFVLEEFICKDISGNNITYAREVFKGYKYIYHN